MSTQLSHDELRSLLAPYALDAVDADEAETVELHLRECAACRAEVAEFRETAAALATTYEPTPPALWDRIAGAIDDEARPQSADVVPFAGRRPDGARRRIAVAVAAAAAAVIAVLAVQLVRQGDEIDELRVALGDRTMLSAALAAESNPDSRSVELKSSDGVVVARAVLLPNGTGFLLSDGLPAVGDDRTYQLWAVVGTERISAGVLGNDPHVVPFQAAGDVSALALTEEVSGGVVASQNQFVAAGPVADA
jgi:anti-sigma-K factor RskA